MQIKKFSKGLILLLLSIQVAFGVDVAQLQQDLGRLQTQLTRLEGLLPTIQPAVEPTTLPAPKAIVRVYVMANAFIPYRDPNTGQTKIIEEEIRKGMLLPGDRTTFYDPNNFDKMIQGSGIGSDQWDTFAKRAQKPHITLVDFDIPVYDQQDQIFSLEGPALVQYLNTTYAQPFRKLVLSKSIDSQLNFKQLDFLQDFFGARFKPDSNAQALRKQIIRLVTAQYPTAKLEFPTWQPHMSLYRLEIDPATGEYVADREQLIRNLKQPRRGAIESFKITDKGQIQVTPELLKTGPKFNKAAQKFMEEQ